MSKKMERIVVNLQTGEQSVVPFTPEEEAQFLAYAAEEARLTAEQAAQKPTLEQLQAQLAALQSRIAELANQ